jgi:hypothetical protein
MNALTCPRCGAEQPEDRPSFACAACGADLAGPPPGPGDGTGGVPAREGGDRTGATGGPDSLPGEAVDATPPPRAGEGSWRRTRSPYALAAFLAVAALALVLATRFCVDSVGDEPGRALAQRVLGEERVELPIPLHELPPARAAGLDGVPVKPAAGAVPSPGTIRGRLTWGRVRPPPTLSFLSSDPHCGVTVQLPLVPTGSEGGVPEALVVALPEGGGTRADSRTEPLVATLRACLPVPRILAGPPGTPVELRTVGPAVHELAASAPLPGLPGRLEPGRPLRTRIPDAGTVHLSDPAHPWERITLIAVPTSLATTVNAEGFFRFAGVPPGKVTLRFFTEATGPFDRLVELPPSGDAMVQVDLADEVPGFGPVRSAGSP